MKKILIILLILLCLVGCSKSTENEIVDNPPIEDNNIVEINLFHWNQCSHCQEEIEWLKELVERNDYIKVNYYEVTEYEELVYNVRNELGVLGEGVPLTVIGTDYILGYGDSTKAKIMNMVDKYKEIDYCDIVKTIQNNEDTSKCYLQNAENN